MHLGKPRPVQLKALLSDREDVIRRALNETNVEILADDYHLAARESS